MQGERGTGGCRRNCHGERGQVVVLFALLLPMLLSLGAIVITLGNWYTHAKHLQTKADAGALAAGSAWDLPCDASIDARIEEAARAYVGPHMKADGTPHSGTTYNPQVGGVDGSEVHVVLNGSDWYDDDSNAVPTEMDAPGGSICEAGVLDVKVTEDNSFPLFSLVPLYPDIKRKARVELKQVQGLSGLRPIAVRFPAPESAAAVFYDEASASGTILSVRYFRSDEGIVDLPAGLQGYSTYDSEDPGSWATFQVPSSKVGVVIATSVRPACDEDGEPAPCLEDEGFTTVNQLCNQAGGAIVQCFYGTRSGSAQTVRSGLHFVRGYPEGDVGQGAPRLRGAWLTNVGCPANGYFNTNLVTTCQTQLRVTVDVGSMMGNPPPNPPDDIVETRTAENTQVRYKLVRAGGTVVCDFGPSCDLTQRSGGSPEVTLSTDTGTHLQLARDSRANALAVEVRLKHTIVPGRPECTLDTTFESTPPCAWFFTGNTITETTPPTVAEVLAAPVQRSFVGVDDPDDPFEAVSGPIAFLRLTADTDGDGFLDEIDWDAASQPIGSTPGFYVEMGLIGALAESQSDPPIALKLSGPGSQRAMVDCNPNVPPWPERDDFSEEIYLGCVYSTFAPNDFSRDPPCSTATGENHYFLSPPGDAPGPAEPWRSEWPPITCIFTKTGNFPEEISAGFRKLVLGSETETTCPTDSAMMWVKGRNYWSDADNMNDEYTFPHFHEDDPRVLTLFFSTYDSYTGAGNKQYPIVGLGVFYIRGWGKLLPGRVEIHDPCPGNTPPPTMIGTSANAGSSMIWGNFIQDATRSFNSIPSGEACRVGSLTPCVAVLVE